MAIQRCRLENAGQIGRKNFVPVGTIEFVQEYLEGTIGVPRELLMPVGNPWAPRKWTDELDPDREVFVKDTKVFKSPWNGLRKGRELPAGHLWEVSEPIRDIKAEWRCFLRDRKLLAVQPYSGDPLVFPDPAQIKGLISDSIFGGLPACTLDVMVTASGETKPIEVHEFFSCGLYGFDDSTQLPWMYLRAWQAILRRFGRTDILPSLTA